MASIATPQVPQALPINAVGISLSAFSVISFVLCVLGGVLFPGMIVHRMLELFLPGFQWLSWSSFIVGLIGSVGWAWYIALVFVPIYNFVQSRW